MGRSRREGRGERSGRIEVEMRRDIMLLCDNSFTTRSALFGTSFRFVLQVFSPCVQTTETKGTTDGAHSLHRGRRRHVGGVAKCKAKAGGCASDCGGESTFETFLGRLLRPLSGTILAVWIPPIMAADATVPRGPTQAVRGQNLTIKQVIPESQASVSELARVLVHQEPPADCQALG